MSSFDPDLLFQCTFASPPDGLSPNSNGGIVGGGVEPFLSPLTIHRERSDLITLHNAYGRGGTLNRNQRAAARQLSLAAFLLYDDGSHRDEASIRRNLPLYESVYEASLEKGDGELASDALRKQLARDVEALAVVGIRVVVEGASEGRRYSLPAEGFSPAELELSVEERSVFVGALRALRRDFPYAGPLRLAIANMIGAVSEESEAFAAIATREDENVARRVAVLEKAISRRKRVRFEYFSISRDETSTREVEPHSLSLVDGVWYMSGWDTNREDIRQFRMSRVRGLIKNATRRDSPDFDAPDTSDRRYAGPRAPWQLGEPDKTARIRVSGETLDAAMHAYPGVVYRDGDELATGYSGERQLAGWTLSLGGEVVSPDSLKERVVEGLEKIAATHGWPI